MPAPAARGSLAAHVPEQLPPAGEVSGEKQREQQTDRFDRLHRPEIDLARRSSRARAEQDQQYRQRQRADERQIAERQEPAAAKSTSDSPAISSQADDDAFREAHEQQAVAQRIGPAQQHGEADRR